MLSFCINNIWVDGVNVYVPTDLLEVVVCFWMLTCSGVGSVLLSGTLSVCRLPCLSSRVGFVNPLCFSIRGVGSVSPFAVNPDWDDVFCCCVGWFDTLHKICKSLSRLPAGMSFSSTSVRFESLMCLGKGPSSARALLQVHVLFFLLSAWRRVPLFMSIMDTLECKYYSRKITHDPIWLLTNTWRALLPRRDLLLRLPWLHEKIVCYFLPSWSFMKTFKCNLVCFATSVSV